MIPRVEAEKRPTKLADQLAGVVRQPIPVLPPGPPVFVDTCGCIKEAGCYGREGWHIRRFGRADLKREVLRSLDRLPLGASEDDRAAAKARAVENFKRYMGEPLAYERCPAYMEAIVRESQERGFRRATQGGSGAAVLDDDL